LKKRGDFIEEVIVEEKKCPICEENVRSDANIHEFCKLCGMGIPEPSEVPKLQTEEETLYFCCDRCHSIYKEKIPKK